MDDLLSTPPASALLASAVVLDELAVLGVTDVVCCPGSRSAPLAYAAARLEAQGRLRLHMRLDERGAGFFGLGIAKATSRAVALITTSGTAVANLAPAMAEAKYARVPLIALTADRPSTLVGTGANQTADQVGIFGTIPLVTFRLAGADQAPQAWRSLVRRAVVAAEGRLTHRPGPVHINVELAAPLMGEADRVPPGVPFAVHSAPPARAVRVPTGPRAVIVAGDMPPDQGQWWALEAERTHVPLLAEPSSNARRGPAAVAGYRHLLAGFAPMIEKVIVVGHPTLSRPVTALLSRTDVEIIAVDPSGEWPDPGWAVSAVVPAARLDLGDPAWLGKWIGADRGLRAHMEAEQAWSGEMVASTLIAHLRERDWLVLGASNPIRDADLAPIGGHPPTVLANRGLAGIDGVIATAAGVAAGVGAPVFALLGDLGTIHDIGSLARPVLASQSSLTIVVANDHGGSLFSTLEYGAPRSQIGELADWFERIFAVEMAVDLGQVAKGFGVDCVCVKDESQLVAALGDQTPGVRMIQAELTRDDRLAREKRLASWGLKAARQALA